MIAVKVRLNRTIYTAELAANGFVLLKENDEWRGRTVWDGSHLGWCHLPIEATHALEKELRKACGPGM